MNTLHTLFIKTQKQLMNHSQSPRDDALALIQALSQEALFSPITHPDRTLSQNQIQTLDAWTKKRLSGWPIAYIIGKQPFWQHTFEVSPDTLIPRPETEHLIEQVLSTLEDKPLSLLDMGCGCGAIVISLALARAQWQCSALDISPSALSIAKKNALHLGALSIQWHQSDWWENLSTATFDIIVSNPPYIAQDDPHLASGDLRFEPSSALHSGTKGTEDLATIIQGASMHLNPKGWLFLEHGFDQGPWVLKRLKQAGFNAITQHKDHLGHTRISQAQRS